MRGAIVGRESCDRGTPFSEEIQLASTETCGLELQNFKRRGGGVFFQAVGTEAIAVAFAKGDERLTIERDRLAPAATLRRSAPEGFTACRTDFRFRHEALCHTSIWASIESE